MKNKIETQLFEEYLGHVSRARSEILQNRYPVLPSNYGDPLDEDDENFLKCYEKLRKFLKKYWRKDRFFFSPPGQLLRSECFKAETAHEALMFFLIKPREYHDPEILISPEYIYLASEVQKELRDRQLDIEIGLREKKQLFKNQKEQIELGMLHRVVNNSIEKKEINSKPLTWHEIADQLPQNPPWSQSKISRMLAKLLNASNSKGMTAYVNLFMKSEPPKGYIRKNSEGKIIRNRIVYDSNLLK